MTVTLAPAQAPERPTAHDVQLAFAEAWGEMGPAWGVSPSVARVHGFLMAHGGVLTEREIRESLELSHRATSLALAAIEEWGLVERVHDPRRSGRRGPSATAWRVAGDRWLWFQRVAEQRHAREADPLRPRLEVCVLAADAAVQASPADAEAARLRDWLVELQGFLGLFDRAVSLLARAESSELARGFAVLARLSDESLDRLLRLFGSLPDDELAETIEGVSRVSPGLARTILRTVNRVARLGG